MDPTTLPRRDRTRMSGAERREQILQAATLLIAERGFWGLSLQDVADVCRISVPGVLHHIASKDDLLVAVLEHRDAEDTSALAAELGTSEADLLSQDTPRWLSMPDICSAIVRRNVRRPELVRLGVVLEAEALAPTHPAHDFFRRRRLQTLTTWTTGFGPVSDDPATLARQTLALMDGLQLQWLSDPEHTDLVADWDRASSLLFASTTRLSASNTHTSATAPTG